MEYYRHRKLDGDITAIFSISGENMYLIEGSQKAVLIDAGVGLGNLKEYVDNLTHKDLTVILTHGHMDHAMGGAQFEAVYMNGADEGLYYKGMDPEKRIQYIQMGLPDPTMGITQESLNPKTDLHYKMLQDGDSFDLGGIHIDVYSLPGHTPGSMVVLIREKGILILGDACTDATFLFGEEASSVEEYYENLQKVSKKLEGKYQTVFRSHGEPNVDKDMLKKVIQVCEDIFQGDVDAVPVDFLGDVGYIAKKTGENHQRLDGETGNIVYRRIYKGEAEV